MALTDKQKLVYDFILHHQIETGIPPTQREIKEHFGFKSFGSVQKYLQYLEDQGLLEKDWNARRGIKVVAPPQTDHLKPLIQIPIIGRIAAGVPLLALENWEETLSFPREMLGAGSEFFALKVKGDSMIGAGINNGDMALFSVQNDAPEGHIVAAMIHNEVTLKRFYKKQGQIELHSENPLYSPIIIKPQNEEENTCQIIGLLKAMWRWYH